MNQIPAPRAGTVKRILVEDGTPGRIRRAADDHRMSARQAGRTDVQQDPDRQPRRDRAARHPRLPRDGHQVGRGPLHRRRRCDACAHGRRKRLHRAGAVVGKLSDQCRASSRPARSPAPRRSIRATASCPRTPAFAQALEDHGITFIGPTAEHIRIMGDKITAKETMRRRSAFPCVPGSDGGVPTLETRRTVARRASAIRSSSRRRPAAAGAA